jgi:hypothetical protein
MQHQECSAKILQKAKSKCLADTEARPSWCREKSWQRELLGKDTFSGGLMRGQISPRMGVIIAYVALLHLAVLMCFTRHHSTPDCGLRSLP